ncbi:bifunctional PGK/TIM [Peptococcaceae bacterium CEB3]|nr:bifunctional PGK/TIM [Peptococcaceae bacterium CEB3]
MKEIFVNLKRFDVPKEMGGVCNMTNPQTWIHWVIDESVKGGLGKLKGTKVTFLLPEGLIMAAKDKLAAYPIEDTEAINIGCQGVYREDVENGGNFGAFTTNRPASAAKNLGCTWTIIGHSEEVKDKLEIMTAYDPQIAKDEEKRGKAKRAIHPLINQEVLCALRAGMNVLLCVGETAEERGQGTPEEQKARVKKVLKEQLEEELKGFPLERRGSQVNPVNQGDKEGQTSRSDRVNQAYSGNRIVLAYEPVWAIGPGKIPPEPQYISFVALYLKQLFLELFGVDIPVVYGGGLKEDNAGAIAGLEGIAGGLVALTKFIGEIGFFPDDLKRIVSIVSSP